jgi:hypothetical protein
VFRTKIDLNTKPEGYKEALEAYIAKHKVIGMQTEYGIPDLTPYKEPKRRLWRLQQINPSNVCAVLKEPVYDAGENSYSFVAHFHGGRRDALERHRGKVTLGARMMRDSNGNVTEIMQLDFILTENQQDTAHEEASKGKRKK